jgi:putative transposase
LGGKNLAVNPEGKWVASYVPAALRKYPFHLASNKDDLEQKIVMIDEESNLFSKSKGKQIFKKNGEESDVLKNAVKFLTDFEQNFQLTKIASKAFAEAGILEDKEIAIGEGEERKVLLTGFKVINKEALNKLDDKTLAAWARNGMLTLADTHLKSLNNIQNLFNLAQSNK